MTYHHTGIPVGEKMDGMMYVESLKVWVTDAAASPYRTEFLFFEPDSPMPGAVRGGTHVAYGVDDIEAAVRGKNVLWPVCEPAPGLKIAFIFDGGLPVELMQMG